MTKGMLLYCQSNEWSHCEATGNWTGELEKIALIVLPGVIRCMCTVQSVCESRLWRPEWMLMDTLLTCQWMVWNIELWHCVDITANVIQQMLAQITGVVDLMGRHGRISLCVNAFCVLNAQMALRCCVPPQHFVVIVINELVDLSWPQTHKRPKCKT